MPFKKYLESFTTLNTFHSENNELKEGESICTDCNGTGYLKSEDKSTFCPVCHGAGKLTWTEKICGKRNPHDPLVMPLIRTFFPSTLASQIVSVQPMDKPASLKYYMKSKIKKKVKKSAK